MSETIKKITTPFEASDISNLKAGDAVSITGVIYTARDKAHQRMVETLAQGKELPVDLSGQVIYFAGPTPPKPGQAIGSVGPTTSSRMDAFSPVLIRQAGLKGMIGKGPRSEDVVEAMQEKGALYLVAVGGTGAAISNSVKKAEVIAYEDLGTEAIRRLEVEDFAAIVAIDASGSDLFKIGREAYAQKEG